MSHTLLQQARESFLQPVLIGSLVLIAVVIVGLLVVSQVKKRFQGNEGEQPEQAGFTLSDLRQLHRSGQMSDEEFERAKAKVILSAKRAADRNAPPADDENTGTPGLP